MNRTIGYLVVFFIALGTVFFVLKMNRQDEMSPLAKKMIEEYESILQKEPTGLQEEMFNSYEIEDPFSIRTARMFTLPSVVDPKKRVTEDIFKGKVTILNVWASWCGPCRQETDTLMALAKDSGVFWVGLNINDDLEEAQRMLQIYGNPYHETIYDRGGKLSREFGVRATPEVFILDKEGKIQYRHMGIIDEWVWKEEIMPILQDLK